MKDLKEILEDNKIPAVERLQSRARAMNAKKVPPTCKRCNGKRRVIRKASLFPRVPEVAIKCDGCA
jgi:hypothetical protein